MKLSMILTALLSTCLLQAAPEPQNARPAPPDPPPPRRQEARPRHGVHFGRVFSEMTPEERKEMYALQAKDSAAFRQKMEEKLAEIEKKDKEREQKIKTLVGFCLGSDKARAEAALKELTEIVRTGYMKRLDANERYLNDLKKRTQKLEAYLTTKRTNAEQEIQETVRKILSGERPGHGPDNSSSPHAAPQQPSPQQTPAK